MCVLYAYMYVFCEYVYACMLFMCAAHVYYAGVRVVPDEGVVGNRHIAPCGGFGLFLSLDHTSL
jgi:hypothetical protein